MKIKRVALVHSSGAVAYFAEEYPAFVRDIDILNMLYEVGKNVWYGDELYKVCVLTLAAIVVSFVMKYSK